MYSQRVSVAVREEPTIKIPKVKKAKEGVAIAKPPQKKLHTALKSQKMAAKVGVAKSPVAKKKPPATAHSLVPPKPVPHPQKKAPLSTTALLNQQKGSFPASPPTFVSPFGAPPKQDVPVIPMIPKTAPVALSSPSFGGVVDPEVHPFPPPPPPP